jgi:predicted GNAT family N-acyltransferase
VEDIRVSRVQSKADYQAALAVRRAVFVDEQGVSEALEIDEHEAGSVHFVCWYAGRPAGAGRLRRKGSYAKFERIAVLQEHRGKHLGRALMAAMEEYAAREFPELLPAMHAQEPAISFYEQIGWRAEGPVFYEAGIPHRFMVKAHRRL